MHPVVFSPAWFERYQTVLLGLLRMPVIGRELRDVLAIGRHDVGYDGRIVRITPHSYTVANPDGTFTTDVRTHAKYAKRLRYQLDGLWQAAHAWDQYVANPLVPALNVGFDTLTVYPDAGSPGTTTCDGNVYRNGVSEAWATIKSGAGTANATGDSLIYPVYVDWDSANANRFTVFGRMFALFDTSSLPDTASITSATIGLYGENSSDNAGNTPSINVYSASPTSNTILATTDFNACGTTAMLDTSYPYSSWVTAAYNSLTLNATGRANIALTGVSKFSFREPSYDVSTATPTWGFFYFRCYSADQLGSTNDPKLEVTYSIPGLLLVKN